MKTENKNQTVSTITNKSTFLGVAALLILPHLSGSNLLKRYKGSSQEKALDAQIKAIKNMKTFGSPYKKFEHQLPKNNRELVLEWIRENPEEFRKLVEIYQKRKSLEKESLKQQKQ
jgi:hypothetical protein